MKIILDTNVLYSSFIRDSERMRRLIQVALADHEVFVTSKIVDEILSKAEERAPGTVPGIRAFLSGSPIRFLDDRLLPDDSRQIIRDKNDQSILDAAMANDIDLIVTGDKDFHALEFHRPRDFAAEFISVQD